MKRHNLILVTMLLVVATYSSAQTTFQEVNQNINYCSGLYYAYPTSLEIDECEPPKGFNAFYISHYGRHGSRWLEWKNRSMLSQWSS